MDQTKNSLNNMEATHRSAANLDQNGVVRPDQVNALWEAEDPNMMLQAILAEYIKELSRTTGQDILTWDENEQRFESSELKWIADFLIHALVFIRNDLNIKDSDRIAHLLQLFWDTLSLLPPCEDADISPNMASRYNILQNGLRASFT